MKNFPNPPVDVRDFTDEAIAVLFNGAVVQREIIRNTDNERDLVAMHDGNLQFLRRVPVDRLDEDVFVMWRENTKAIVDKLREIDKAK